MVTTNRLDTADQARKGVTVLDQSSSSSYAISFGSKTYFQGSSKISGEKLNPLAYLYFQPNQEKKIQEISRLNIRNTETLIFNQPIEVIVERCESGYVASVPALGIHSSGETVNETYEELQFQIEDLWEDLNEDDNLSKEWLAKRNYLSGLINGVLEIS